MEATVCWMDKKPLRMGGTYLVQHGVNVAKAIISALSNLVDVVTMGIDTDISELKLNEIANVRLRTAKGLFFDAFDANKANGSFILIDEQTNATVGVGLIK